MSRVAEIGEKIELVRKKLHRLAESKKYCFVDEDVISLSEQLDRLIVELERCKIRKGK